MTNHYNSVTLFYSVLELSTVGILINHSNKVSQQFGIVESYHSFDQCFDENG